MMMKMTRKKKQMILKMDAEKIADRARNAIGKFCMEECKAYCCRKGYLNMGPESVDIITQGKRAELENNKTLTKINDNNYSLFLGNYNQPCPSLKDFRCAIHKNPKRPEACRQFPVFIRGKTLSLSSRCLAVKQGLLYPYIKKILSLGYTLSENHPYSDLGDVFIGKNYK
jgi:Fe-S-cluster containining protein